MRLAAILTAASLTLAVAAAGQTRGLDPRKALTQLGLDVWTTEQGLPQNTVNALLQSRDGYLWLGTYEGLARFDGVRFSVLNAGNTAGLKSNGIRALCEDDAGGLWVGTNGGGLSHISGGAVRHYPIGGGTGSEVVWALASDGEGGVWVGTGAGLYRLRDGRAVAESVRDAISAIYREPTGVVWVGTYGAGLKHRDPDGSWTSLAVENGLAGNIVSSLAQGRDGGLWVGTVDGGLSLLRGGRSIRYSRREGLPSNVVYTLIEDRAGTLWVGTSGGLARLRDGRISTLTTQTGLPDEVVYALAEDREGSLWIGTNGSGVCRLRDGAFTTYTAQEGLASDHVYSIHQGDDGTLWVGGSGGISRLAEGRWTTLAPPHGLCSGAIRSLAGDGSGGLWIGTYGGGLCRWSQGRFSQQSKKDGLAHDSVRVVLRDRAGALWAGTVAGLSRLAEGRYTTFTTRDGLGKDSVNCLAEDASGVLWVGTDGGGLSRLQDGVFRTLARKDGLASDVVLSLYPDREGDLWVGTNAGLSRLHHGRFATFTAQDGLPSDGVYQMVEDGAGGLWIGGSRGVARVLKTELADRAAGRLARVNALLLGKADGLRSIQCTALAQPPGLRARDGRLWFATAKGAAVLDPADVEADPEAPPVVIEALLADGQEVPGQAPGTGSGGPLRVGPGVRRLAVRYTGLSLQAPERVSFRYQLEGFDPAWVGAGERRVAEYTNVPPGRYRFRVATRSREGSWNPMEATLAIELVPRFYQTVWFLLAAALLAGLVAAGAHRLRTAHLRARERQLEALVEQRTHDAESHRRRAEKANALKTELLGIAAHDLKNPLTTIMGNAELLGLVPDATPRVLEASDSIYRASRGMRDLIEELLATAALEGGSLELDRRRVDLTELAQTVLSDNQHQAERKGQAIRLEAEPGCLAEVDPERMRQAMDNLVSNAVKFSEWDTCVRLVVRRMPGCVRFEVHDQGPGLAIHELKRLFGRFERLSARPTGGESSTGLGLSIAQSVVAMHGGSLWAASAGRGLGSVFVIELPVTSPGSGATTAGRA